MPVTEARVVAPAGVADAAFLLSGRLLVVDDEPAIGRYVSEYLSAEGVDVTAVASGREAFELLGQGTKFDAVLTDLRMPDVSGDKLIAFIGEHRPELSGRVVLMTGDALGPEVTKQTGDVPVVVKPLELKALRAALRPLLGGGDAGKTETTGALAGALKKETA